MRELKTLSQIMECKAVFKVLGGFEPGDDGGKLWLKHPRGHRVQVIASWGMGWDHVSVSLVSRCPSWDEMCWVKDIFFDPEECVIQYHPPKSRYKNCHPHCLHLWRPQSETLPMPPLEVV